MYAHTSSFKRQRQEEKEIPYAYSLPKCQKQPELGQPGARKWELSLEL